jgi:hypothetical protein
MLDKVETKTRESDGVVIVKRHRMALKTKIFQVTNSICRALLLIFLLSSSICDDR